MEEKKKKNITNYMRHFYVNGDLEFSFFYDPDITDKTKILESFRKDHDWKFFEIYYKVKFKEASFSKDLTRVDIVTTPKHNRKTRK
jgi:hypothetical protein